MRRGANCSSQAKNRCHEFRNDLQRGRCTIYADPAIALA